VCCQTQVERPRNSVHRVYFVRLSFCVPEVEFLRWEAVYCNAVRGERKKGHVKYLRQQVTSIEGGSETSTAGYVD